MTTKARLARHAERDAVAVELTPVENLKRQYPHVDGIKDWQTNQTVRLLWDRVFALTEQLTAAQTTLTDLVEATNANKERLTEVNRSAKEALALAQEAVAGGAGGGAPAEGEPTIPDFSHIVEQVAATFNPVIPEAQEEQGKSQMTRAIAWQIYQVDTNIGLLEKTYGNQVNNLSTDIVVQKPNGDYADVSTATNNGDGTVTIKGTWQPHKGDLDLASRWIEPSEAIKLAAPQPMGPA